VSGPEFRLAIVLNSAYLDFVDHKYAPRMEFIYTGHIAHHSGSLCRQCCVTFVALAKRGGNIISGIVISISSVQRPLLCQSISGSAPKADLLPIQCKRGVGGCVALRMDSAVGEDVTEGGESASYLQCGGCQRRPAGFGRERYGLGWWENPTAQKPARPR